MYRRERVTTASFLFALIAHLIGAIILVLTTEQVYEEIELIAISWVDVDAPALRQRKMPLTKVVKPRINLNRDLADRQQPQVEMAGPDNIAEVATRSPNIVRESVQVAQVNDPAAVISRASTYANTREIGAPRLVQSGANVGPTDSGRGAMTGRVRAEGSGGNAKAGIGAIIDSVQTDDIGLSGSELVDFMRVPEGKLGAVLIGEGRNVSGHIRFVRLKHYLADWWQDPTSLVSFMDWLREHTRFDADMKFEGGALELTDDRIMDAPLVIMTGHDQDIVTNRNLARGNNKQLVASLSQDERIALRRYLLDEGGTLYFDDCGFNGLLAEKVRQELRAALPEYDLKNIPHNHEIYNIYYALPVPPTGGDVFWGSENNPHVSLFKYHKGITIDGRLAVVFNRKDYMCAMETAEIESRTLLRMRRSIDVHRFMTNLLVYAMKYGGNTDRSGYER